MPSPRNRYQAAHIAELAEAGRRSAKPHTCGHCSGTCLRGDDNDALSVVATVDTEPIDELGETLALLDGRQTYDITPTTGRTARRGVYVLYRREPWHYGQPRRHPVLVEHTCATSR